MKILANDGISELGKALLEAAGHVVSTDKVSQDELINTINQHGFDAVLVRSATTVRKEVVDACPGLRLIGRGGVGMDNIDVAYAREKGLTVINTPASSSQSVAELVMGQLFSISRFLHDSFKNMSSGDFSTLKKNYAKGVELRGKTIGIVGFGRIGQSLAAYALGAGMKVIAIERRARIQPITLKIGGQTIEIPVKVVDNLHEVLQQLDYISIHVPKQTDGSAVIGAKEFALMKKVTLAFFVIFLSILVYKLADQYIFSWHYVYAPPIPFQAAPSRHHLQPVGLHSDHYQGLVQAR